MTTVQESRSPQLQVPRGSPGTIVKSPSQLSTACLVGSSNSPSPARKRVHPNYLKIDDAVPPNKKLHTPTKEEKETIMKEKEILYKRLAEEKRAAPFYLTPFPLLPLNTKFGPNIYSFLQPQQPQQQPHVVSPPQPLSTNLTHSPSIPVDLSRTKLIPNLTCSSGSSLNINSPGSASSYTSNTAGISGLPTPGGSSVGTPPRPLYPSQIYPTPLLKFPFSPPTPGLLSPWNVSNRSLSVSSSTATPGPVSNGEESASASNGMLQCLVESSSNDASSSLLATSTPRKDDLESSPKKQSGDFGPHSSSSSQHKHQVVTGSTSSNSAAPSAFHSHPHLKSSHLHIPLTSVQSPLSLYQPISPAMHVCSPYAGSVSSCPSVSSSSGCSSASENQDMAASRNYVLSEYHVGPHRLISEKDIDNQSEEATTSGRNTPIDVSVAEDGPVMLRSDVAQKLLSSGSCSTTLSNHSLVATEAQQVTSSSSKGRPRSKQSAKTDSPHPFSVESMSSGCQPSPINPQSYITGCHIVDRPSSGVSSMSSSLSSRDSTPEPDDMKQTPHQPPQGSDIFCLVPGRLSLLSSTQKYRVTVDEVRRRLSHPECLNASVLGGILRRAKSKNGGTVLRQRLQEIGVSLPPGRRKQTELSLLTSLVESESLHLAGDFHRVCENFFPHGELGQIIARQHVGTPEAQHRISMVKATQLIVSELQAMLEAVGGPSNIRPNDPNNPYPGLTNFSLLTHGFGNPAINTGLGVLQTYLQELLAYYEGRKSVQAPENRYTMFGDNAPQTSTSSQSLGVPESESGHGNVPQHNHPLQNSLLYATRNYPADSQDRIPDAEGVAVEVVLKEEPVESPSSYTA